jgi:hypothetical protein
VKVLAAAFESRAVCWAPYQTLHQAVSADRYFSIVLNPLEIVSVAKENLGEQVGSLEEEGDKIIAALDELLTRWR